MPSLLQLRHLLEGSFPIYLQGFGLGVAAIPLLDVFALAEVLIAADEIAEVDYLLREGVELVRDGENKPFLDLLPELLDFPLQLLLRVFGAL